MNQNMDRGRACSGSPDSYEQFYVHKCDVECFLSSVYYAAVYVFLSLIGLKYFCDSFNYRMCSWLKNLEAAERLWFVRFGRKLVAYEYVRMIVELCKSTVTIAAGMVGRMLPQLGSVSRTVARYNTMDVWGVLVAALTIASGYAVTLEFMLSVVYYFRERKMLYFCVNMRPTAAVNCHVFTKKMLRRLYNSQEFRRLKQHRMASGPEAWNWQTRQRLGEPMPSDEMSEDEL